MTQSYLTGRDEMEPEHEPRARSNLHVPVYVLSTDRGTVIHAETENIGLDGFFFYSDYFFSPGDPVTFLLFFSPGATRGHSTNGVWIHGTGEIRKVSIGAANASYGIGCQLVRYRILPDHTLCPTDEEVERILRSELM
jgi:hypothetical protein